MAIDSSTPHLAGSAHPNYPGQTPSGAPVPGAAVNYGHYVNEQIEHTRDQVKLMEVASESALLIVVFLGYVLAWVVADHWLVAGGLSVALRFVAFAVLVVLGVGLYCWRILPLLIRRINPIYAAAAIEKSQPSLKNSLINFLMLRRDSAALPQVVVQMVEQRAASDLSHTPIDSAVDRSRVLRFSYILLALAFLFVGYKVFSPKDPLQSAGRMMFPWADLAPATRVTIRELEPGDANIYSGEWLTVRAMITGLRDDEQVLLYFSTKDGAAHERPIEMKRPLDGLRYQVVLPEETSGFGQDGEYYIVAGDVRTRKYAIHVSPAPSIVVEKVELKYPAYTGIKTEVVDHGDFEAIEGTIVSVFAKANQKIQASSPILDFGCDGKSPYLRMFAEGQSASADYTLSASPEAKHETYLVRFKNEDGRENPKPTRHRVMIIRDLPPTVAFTEPNRDTKAYVDQTVVFKLTAEDPDFALAKVALKMQRDGRDVLLSDAGLLLREVHRGLFETRFAFVPEKLGLKPGDIVTYWAEATDIRAPHPNSSKTESFKIEIVAANPLADQPGNRQPEQVAGRDPERDQQPGGQGQPGAGEGKPSEQKAQGGQGGQPSREPMDGDRNPMDPAGEHREPGQGPPPDPQGAKEQDQLAQNRKPESDGDIFEELLRDMPPEAQPEGEDGEGKAGEAEPDVRDPKRRDDPKRAGDEEPTKPAEDRGDGDSGQKPPPEGERRPGGGKEDSRRSGKPEDGDAAQQDMPAGAGAREPGASQPQAPNQHVPTETDDSQQDGDDAPMKKPGEQAGESKTEKPDPSKIPGEERAPQGAKKPPLDQKEPGGEQKPGEEKEDGKKEPGGEQKPKDEEQTPGGQKQSSGQKTGGGQSGAGGSSGGEGGGQKGSGGEADGAQGDGQKGSGGQQQTGGEKGTGGESAAGKTPGDKQAEGKPEGQGKQPEKGSEGPQQSGQEGTEESPAQGKGKPSSRQDQKPGESGKPSEQGQPSGHGTSPGEGKQPGQEHGDEKTQPGQPKGKPMEEGADAKAGTPMQPTPDTQTEARDEKGQGAQSTPRLKPEEQKPSKEEGTDAKGGDPEHTKGNSGAGKKPQDDTGTTTPQKTETGEKTTPRDKKPGGGDEGKEDKGQSGSSPSNSKKESDSQGESRGDKAGGGGQGGGQKANQEGTGGAGSNTAADEGSNQAPGSGKGDPGQKAGDQALADAPTGKSSGNQEGNGSQQKSGQGTAPGGEGEAKPGEGAAPDSPEGQAKPKQPKAGDQPGGAAQGTGGEPDKSVARQPSRTSGGDAPVTGGDRAPDEVGAKRDGSNSPGGDEADLDFARKATDLVLSRLKDELQKETPDPKLLERLGWTRDDMQKFVTQWDKLRQSAEQPGADGAEARRKLEQRLRALGLTRSGTRLDSRVGEGDKIKQLQEGSRFEVPAEYADQVEAYRSGVNSKLGPTQVKP